MNTKNIIWERLDSPLEILLNDENFCFDNNINLFNVKFKRNEEYELVAIFNGHVDENTVANKIFQFFESNAEFVIKSLNEPNDIKFRCKSIFNLEYKLNIYSVTLLLYSLEYGDFDTDCEWMSRWYINGPKMNFPKSSVYLDSNSNPYKSLSENKELQINFINGVNYFLVEPENTNSFIVSKITKTLTPSWSSKIGIDFFKEFGFPQKENIKQIEEILSFVFARSLINIGESYFDKRGTILGFKAYNPPLSSMLNLKHICSENGIPPTKFSPQNNEIEEVLAFLLDEYIKSEINYTNVFGYLRESLNLPSFVSIILVASSLDFLSNDYFNKKSMTEQYHLPPNEFESIIGDELKKIDEKLKNYNNVVDIIHGAYEKRGVIRLDAFFEKLEIQVTNFEKKSFFYRHIPSHGNILDLNKAKKFQLRTIVYRTIVYRCILKSLNYDGKYYDFFSKTNKDLKEPIKKSDFNDVLHSLDVIIMD